MPLIRDTDQALTTLRVLKDIGVTVAVGDFGTGYSSLAELRTLPIDTLKIDRGFVHDLGVSAHDLAIVQSIIGLAGSFGLQLVAEGAETEIAAATLVALGCTRAQGFLFAKPCAAWEIESVLEHGIPTFGKKCRSPDNTPAGAGTSIGQAGRPSTSSVVGSPDTLAAAAGKSAPSLPVPDTDDHGNSASGMVQGLER